MSSNILKGAAGCFLGSLSRALVSGSSAEPWCQGSSCNVENGLESVFLFLATTREAFFLSEIKTSKNQIESIPLRRVGNLSSTEWTLKTGTLQPPGHSNLVSIPLGVLQPRVTGRHIKMVACHFRSQHFPEQ